jgi:hypothetical protein
VNRRATPVALATAAVALGFASAAGAPGDPAAARSARLAAGPSARSAAAIEGPSIRSRAARLAAGRSMTVLTVPRIGWFVVACGADRRSRVTFRRDQLLPTSDIVITGPRQGRTVSATWQIAPFASAGVRVTWAHVVSRPLSPRQLFGCAASAIAIVGPDQGPTEEAG